LIVRAAVLTGLVALFTGCASELDREHCDDYDGAPASVERRVRGGLVSVDKARVLECQSVPYGRPDEDYCLFALDPRDFATMFPESAYFSPRTPPASRFAMPERHGVVLSGGLGGWPHGDRVVYFNEERDRAFVVVHNFRCHTPRDFVN
jgi:hypothetical protein